MCEFFSFVGDGFGNYKYLDWEYRKSYLEENCDSHTYILTKANIPPEMQDRWSKYEYNPLTKEFIVDQGIEGHNHSDAEAWVSKLNFKTIVEPLIIKKIVDPFKLEKRKPTQEDIEDLEKWVPMWNLVKNSGRRECVGDRMEDLIRDSVRRAMGGLVWNLVWNLVRNSVRNLARGSVLDSIYIYLASFLDIKYDYDFSSLWRLWDRGLVPSYDGTTWRLHSGKKGEVVYIREP